MKQLNVPLLLVLKWCFNIINGGLGSAVKLRFESVREGSISAQKRAFKDTLLLFRMYLHTRIVELLYKRNITLVAMNYYCIHNWITTVPIYSHITLLWYLWSVYTWPSYLNELVELGSSYQSNWSLYNKTLTCFLLQGSFVATKSVMCQQTVHQQSNCMWTFLSAISVSVKLSWGRRWDLLPSPLVYPRKGEQCGSFLWQGHLEIDRGCQTVA